MFATESGLVGLKRVTSLEDERGWADVLGDLPLFARFGRRRLRELVKLGRFSEYAPGEVVIAAGQPADFLYVILSGEAKVLASAADAHSGSATTSASLRCSTRSRGRRRWSQPVSCT